MSWARAWRLSHQVGSYLRPKRLNSSGTLFTRRQFAIHAAGFGIASGLIEIRSPEESHVGKNPSRISLQDVFSDEVQSQSLVLPKDIPDLHFRGDHDSGVDQIVEKARESLERVKRGFTDRLSNDEGRTVLNLIAANAAVYALWKVAPANFMVRHFASSLDAMRRRPYTALTANFSHMGGFHLFCNMFLLDMFGRDVVGILSPNRFYVLYIAGGIASVLGSLASRRLLRNNVLSLGASGAVMATMTFYAMLFPEREVYVFGLWKLKCRDALVCWALFDCAGLLGSFGKIDFAAHITGVAFAWLYYNFIREDLSREVRARQKSWSLWSYAEQGNNNVGTFRR